MLMMSFADALTRANSSFMYFLQFYLLNFLTFFIGGGLIGGFEPPNPLSGYANEITRERGHESPEFGVEVH